MSSEGMATFGTRITGGPSATRAWGAAVGTDGALAFTGACCGTVDFGTGPLTARSRDHTDIYIVSVAPPPPP